jgi:hypothetical protein
MIRTRKPKLKSYRYKFEGTPKEPIVPVVPIEDKEIEQLSGQVNGKTASDIEERFAKSMAGMQTVKGYQFRYVFFGPRNSTGSVEVDYLAVLAGGRAYAILIDGEYSHKSAAQIGRDKLNDQKLWSKLRGQISAPPIRIPADKLSNQEMSDATAKELLL